MTVPAIGILRLYSRKNPQTSHLFVSTLRAALPFPIQQRQVDNGTAFPLAFALAVRQAGMRLRYLKPRCPEQNGKVERGHRVDEEAFWSRSTFEGFTSAAQALLAWERRYHHERFPMALSGPTSAENLATFTAASSSVPSVTVIQNPSSTLTSASPDNS